LTYVWLAVVVLGVVDVFVFLTPVLFVTVVGVVASLDVAVSVVAAGDVVVGAVDAVFFIRGVRFVFGVGVVAVVAAVELSEDVAVVASVAVFFEVEDLALCVLPVVPVLVVVSEDGAASVAAVAPVAVFDFDLALPVFVLPVAGVASAVLAVSVEAAVEVFFFFDVDFLVVAFLAVPVIVVAVCALTLNDAIANMESAKTAMTNLVEIVPFVKNRAFILSSPI